MLICLRDSRRLLPQLAWKPFLGSLALLLAAVLPAPAALPTDPAVQAQLIGQPSEVIVQPPVITLAGPRAMQQLVISGRYADQTVRDLTPFSELTLETDAVATLQTGGFLLAKQNGTTTLRVQVGGQTVRVPVTVQDYDKPQPVRFRHEMI